MLTRTPRRRFDSVSSGEARPAPSTFIPTPAYSHVSTYRSLQMEMQIHSPSMKATASQGDEETTLLPVYGDHDQVRGRVILDPSCSSVGRLTISVTGSMSYPPLRSNKAGALGNVIEKGTHMFLSSTTSIPISPTYDTPRSAFREAFTSSIRRRPSGSNLNTTSASMDRSYSFTFDLPRGSRSGEELPPTCSSIKEEEVGLSGISNAKGYSIDYSVTALWEPGDGYESSSFLTAPIILQPEKDFQSIDVSSTQHGSWLEMPLRSDRPIPFRCAVTLPSSVTFSRGNAIPFFVVFATTPRSASLAKEIAADATISVSLIQQVTIVEVTSPLPTPPHSPSGSSDESDAPKTGKLLKRVVKSGPSRAARNSSSSSQSSDSGGDHRDKPLPKLPAQSLFDSQTLQSSMCIGFPKRPRNPCHDSQSHLPLATHNMLPDGLHKSKVSLNKSMLASVDWAGLSVKYYLDVSVLVGQDDLRARIPIRII